jgi:hypothetical protein
MRTSLSPLIRDIEHHLRETFDGVVIKRNLGGDGLIVHLGDRTFAVQPPLVASADAEASWPIYVVPVPAPARESWECTSLEDVVESLAWPHATPSTRLVRLEDVRRGLVLAEEEEVSRRRGAA